MEEGGRSGWKEWVEERAFRPACRRVLMGFIECCINNVLLPDQVDLEYLSQQSWRNSSSPQRKLWECCIDKVQSPL